MHVSIIEEYVRHAERKSHIYKGSNRVFGVFTQEEYCYLDIMYGKHEKVERKRLKKITEIEENCLMKLVYTVDEDDKVKEAVRRINTGYKSRSDDNLDTIIQANRLSYKDTLYYVLELAYIVEHLHCGHNCMHGNISPKNIFECSERGSRYLKLEKDLYLGIPEVVKHSNKTGEYIELCHYKAPEVVKTQTETWEYNTDLYGLGMSMFYMLTKRLPYENSQEFESYIAKEKKVVPSEYNNEVTKAIDRICGKAINHNPEERYQSIGKFIRDLKKEVDLSTYRKFRLFLWR